MSRITFDLDALRSFVVGIELGGFAKAADRLGRSTSAVSAQLRETSSRLKATSPSGVAFPSKAKTRCPLRSRHPGFGVVNLLKHNAIRSF